jgi:hypothetical protein
MCTLQQEWSFNAIWYTFLLMPFTVLELGEELAAANLAQVRWLNGKRCLTLTEFSSPTMSPTTTKGRCGCECRLSMTLTPSTAA